MYLLAYSDGDVRAMSTNLEKLRGKLVAVDAAPSLRRVNGWGCSLVGRYKDPAIAPFYFVLHVFTIVWIPVVPLGIYLVTGDMGGYRFYATISARNFASLYPDGIPKLVGSCLMESVLWLVGVLVFLSFVAIVFTALRGHYRCFWC